MSILSTYDPEIAKQVYADERVEDIAKEMLRDGDSVEKVTRITKLSLETIRELQHNLLAV